MRLIYVLVIIIILLGLAIGLTLSREKVDLSDWRKGKVDLHWEYVDTTIKAFPEVLEMNYFEQQNDIYNLFVLSKRSKVERSEENVIQGEYSAKITFGATWEEVVLVYFPQDWKNYRYLRLDIYNPQPNPLHLEFRIGDFFDAKSFYLSSQKFKKEIELRSGWNELNFSLEEIGEKIDQKSSYKSIHLSFFPQAKEVVYLDNLRLVKR
ncbi:MAG: hypothetical protein MUO85_08840 [candidate division Zixibacteria bacterium]|nr:hypothetical protein [candidate division Zixibacteria bacterium]